MDLKLPPEILWAIAGFFAVKIVDWVLSLKKKDEDLKDETVKRLEVTLEENTEQMRELKYAIKSLEKSVAPIPKLEKDIDEAHVKIRELKASLAPVK